MTAQTKTYDIQVTNDTDYEDYDDYDFVVRSYHTDDRTIRVRVLAEMSNFFEGVLQRSHKVVSFAEVVTK